MQVYLNENVFMGLVLSSVEVFRKECFGLILGYQADGKFIVEHAIPYQSVRRGHTWTELRSDKWLLIKEILKNFPKLDVIGDYHSHTMYRDVRARVSLSRDDIENMESHELQIVIAINENKRTKNWTLNFDNTISGSIDKYHFKIAAYYFENGDSSKENPKLAEILCPFAMGYK